MSDRKPPSIRLGSLRDTQSSRAGQDQKAAEAKTDLTSPHLYEGILVRRSCAAILDFTLAVILSAVLTLATCTASVFTLGLLSIPGFLIAPFVILALMATLMIAGPRSATLGMRALGVRVVALDGRRVDRVQAFLMVAMYLASFTIFFPVLALGLFTERARLLHDIVVGTVVIRSDPV
ncbi:MAG: RDD family protein [Rhodospirillaceae bacterium]|nr:RDD family protein [Rhodospirillaceae bacterium]